MIKQILYILSVRMSVSTGYKTGVVVVLQRSIQGQRVPQQIVSPNYYSTEILLYIYICNLILFCTFSKNVGFYGI